MGAGRSAHPPELGRAGRGRGHGGSVRVLWRRAAGVLGRQWLRAQRRSSSAWLPGENFLLQVPGVPRCQVWALPLMASRLQETLLRVTQHHVGLHVGVVRPVPRPALPGVLTPALQTSRLWQMLPGSTQAAVRCALGRQPPAPLSGSASPSRSRCCSSGGGPGRSQRGCGTSGRPFGWVGVRIRQLPVRPCAPPFLTRVLLPRGPGRAGPI